MATALLVLPAAILTGSAAFIALPILWVDFQQTFLKAVLAGYIIGGGRTHDDI